MYFESIVDKHKIKDKDIVHMFFTVNGKCLVFERVESTGQL
jgi:hypothetical protein